MQLQPYVSLASLPVCFRAAMLILPLLLPGVMCAQKVPEGFNVELVYGTPDIEHPSAVICDDDGNLFVAEDPMDMRGPSTSPIDRVLMIRWDRATGKPIKTVFCENLSAVFGMLWHDGALYVIDAPHYTRLQDTDGDGVADLRVRLADGFGHEAGQFGLNNHVPSGMCLGMDGMFYVSVGDKGLPKARGADGSTVTLEGGGVFRMRPDGTQLEIVSSGTRNHMDVALDSLDNIFAYGNDDDFGWWTRLIHHVPTGYYGYPYDQKAHNGRYLPPVAELGSGTTCGGACYREAVWPVKYRGNAFFCEWGESKIERFTLTKKGATFEMQVDDFMLAGSLKEFRPIDLCFSPDGRHMYVADWNIAAGGKKDRVGRLFHVWYVGDQAAPQPPRGKSSDPIGSQLRSLNHPSHHERMRAQGRLAAMGNAAIEQLSRLLASDAPKLARVHALWTQNAIRDRIKGFDPSAQWIAALDDADADIRGQAARALGLRRVRTAGDALIKSLGDPDASVRMRAAVALGRIGQAASASPLLAALGEPDEFVRFTMMQAIRKIGNWQPALSRLRTANEKTRATILMTATGQYDVAAVDLLDYWFRHAEQTAERIVALGALAEVHRKADPYTGGWWGGKAASGKPSRPKVHPWQATEKIHTAIFDALGQDSVALRRAALEILHSDPAVATGAKNIGRRLAEIALDDDLPIPLASAALDVLATMPTETARRAIERRLGGPQLLLQAKAIEAYARLQGSQAIGRITRQLDSQDAPVRRAAIAALGSLKANQAVPALMALTTTDSNVRTEAIVALAAIADRRALALFLDGILDENETIRNAASGALSKLGDSIAADLRSLRERNELPAALQKELARVFPKSRQAFAFLHTSTPPALDPSAYSQFATKHAGDATRGKNLFADPKRIACVKCHAIGGVGADVGPDLRGVGSKYPRAELIRSVLEPSNRILTDYEMFIIATGEGEIYQGIIKSQTPGAINLVTSEGKLIRIPTDEIDSKKKSNLSPMPNGLAEGMTLADFADMIAYLESLKQPKSSRGN